MSRHYEAPGKAYQEYCKRVSNLRAFRESILEELCSAMEATTTPNHDTILDLVDKYIYAHNLWLSVFNDREKSRYAD